jgi:YegS/Rv2252/BmrU family lipid kinase
VRVAIIVNPISGTGGRPEPARRRIASAEAALQSRQLDGRVLVTERPGHGATLARDAIASGSELVIAWGGDGTINEVASELVFRDVSLAVIPSGSGNGLARELGIPCQVERAFDVAFGGTDRVIDAGEIEGRLFFNVAGVGLDAQVAHEFAATGLIRRGFSRYIEIALRRLMSFHATDYRIAADGEVVQSRAIVIAIANGRQYGNGALIAPDSRIDDGTLDVVIVGPRSAWRAMMQMPMLFSGRIGSVPGITMLRGREVTIEAAERMVYHADGEPREGGTVIRAAIRPAALRVRVPRSPA